MAEPLILSMLGRHRIETPPSAGPSRSRCQTRDRGGRTASRTARTIPGERRGPGRRRRRREAGSGPAVPWTVRSPSTSTVKRSPGLNRERSARTRRASKTISGKRSVSRTFSRIVAVARGVPRGHRGGLHDDARLDAPLAVLSRDGVDRPGERGRLAVDGVERRGQLPRELRAGGRDHVVKLGGLLCRRDGRRENRGEADGEHSPCACPRYRSCSVSRSQIQNPRSKISQGTPSRRRWCPSAP